MKVHQTWKTRDILDKWKPLQNTWKSMPGVEYKLWTDEDNRNLIKNYYPWFLKMYDEYKYPIQRADAIRPFILYHYGGLYVDLDFEYLNDFTKELDKSKVNLPESPFFFSENVQNSFMYAPKGHPGLKKIIEEISARYHNKHVLKVHKILKKTGPQVYDKVVKDNPELFNLLDQYKFNPPPKSYVPLMKFIKPLYPQAKPIRDNFENTEDLYTRHHCSGSWLDLGYFEISLIICCIVLLLFIILLPFLK